MTASATFSAEMRDQASTWFVRLGEADASEQDWLDFTAWLEADPTRRDAYAAVEALWLDLEVAKPAVVESPVVVPFIPRRARRVWTPVFAGLAAVAAIAAVFVVVVMPNGFSAAPSETYAAAVGTSRPIALADGSKIVLNSGTRITVQLGRRERAVTLDEGEATFDVAHDAARPFRIASGGDRIQVVGTEFDVLHHQGLLTVTVLRGVVAVTAAGSKDSEPLLVAAGRQLRRRDGSASSSIKDVDPAQAFAWRSGRLVYRDQTLDEVAADLSRYVSKPIHVEQAAAGLRVTGVLAIDDETAMVRRLENFLPIKAEISPAEVVLRPDPHNR